MWKWIKLFIRHGIFVLWEYFTKLFRWKKSPKKYDLNKRYALVQRRLTGVLKTIKCNIVVEGKENIPEGVAVFYPNHLSSGDPLIMFDVLDKPTTFVAKIEIEKWPFISTYFKVIEGLFIDRKDLKQSLKVMMKVQEDLIKNKDKNWVIYPEGTRNKDPLMNLKEFHHGSFRCAMKAGVPIVPVAVVGTQRVLSTKYVLKNTPIHVKFLKPIMPEEYAKMDTKQVAKLVQEAVAKELAFNLREKDFNAMKKIDSKHRHNSLK